MATLVAKGVMAAAQGRGLRGSPTRTRVRGRFSAPNGAMGTRWLCLATAVPARAYMQWACDQIKTCAPKVKKTTRTTMLVILRLRAAWAAPTAASRRAEKPLLPVEHHGGTAHRVPGGSLARTRWHAAPHLCCVFPPAPTSKGAYSTYRNARPRRRPRHKRQSRTIPTLIITTLTRRWGHGCLVNLFAARRVRL